MWVCVCYCCNVTAKSVVSACVNCSPYVSVCVCVCYCCNVTAKSVVSACVNCSPYVSVCVCVTAVTSLLRALCQHVFIAPRT